MSQKVRVSPMSWKNTLRVVGHSLAIYFLPAHWFGRSREQVVPRSILL
jgi:hypothetical protein